MSGGGLRSPPSAAHRRPSIFPHALLRLVSTTGDQTFELAAGPHAWSSAAASTSDIAIYDPTISRRHAELIVGADGVQVKDLGSSNGTCINGEPGHGRPARARRHRHLRQGDLPPRRTGAPIRADPAPAIAAEAGPPAAADRARSSS